MNAAGFATLDLPLGGMDTRLRPGAGTAELIENLYYHAGDKVWELMSGALAVAAITTTGVGVTWFTPRPNERYLVVERRLSATQNRVAVYNAQAGTLTTIADRQRIEGDDGASEQFVEHGRWLYFTSAFNAPLRWNGRRTVPVGFDRAAPPVEVWGPDQGFRQHDYATGTYPNEFESKTQRGVGELAEDNQNPAPFRYAYGITFVNDLGQESPMSVLSFASGENTTSAGHSAADGLHLVRIRVPRAAKHVRGVRLWRSVNLAGAQGTTGFPMWLHSEFAAAHGFDFIDHKPDTELVIEWNPDSVGTVPPGARAMAFWQGSSWMAGMPDDPNVVRYSDPNFPEQFPEVNRIVVGSARSGSFVALKPVPRGLVVLKTHGVYLVKGSPIDGYRVETIDETRGTSAPRAVEFVPGIGLFFVHSSGPLLLVGTADDDVSTQILPIGAPIESYLRRQVGKHLGAACSVYDPEHQEVWFHLPHRADNRPSLGLVYHLGSEPMWSVRKSWRISGFAYYRGAVYCTSWDKTNVYRLTRGSREYGAGADGAVEGVYITNPVGQPDPFTLDRVTVVGRAYGSTATVEVAVRGDDEETWQIATGETAGVGRRPTYHTNRTAAEWGTALWSAAAVWQDYGLARTVASIYHRAVRTLQVRLRSSTRATWAGIEASVQTSGGGPRDRERK